MTLQMKYDQIREDSLAEGREEGREEGKLKAMVDLVSSGVLTEDQAAAFLNITTTEFGEIKAIYKDNREQ